MVLLFPFLMVFVAFFIHVRKSMLSSSIYRKHSTARLAALHKAAKQVRADQSATTQAGRQSWRELACRRAFMQSLRSQNERRHRLLPGLRKCTSTPDAAYSWCHARKLCLFFSNIKDTTLQHCSFSPSFQYVFRTCTRRPGCFPGAWSSWHLQVISLHLKSWTDASAHSRFVL